MAFSYPRTLFLATDAGATLAKTFWPGTFTVTRPGSPGEVQSILDATPDVLGCAFKKGGGWAAMRLDFAIVGGADLSPAIEVGRFFHNPDGSKSIAQVLAAATLKSITTSGTVTANLNPFTGEAVAATTFRLIDRVTLTNYSNLGQVLVGQGGTENNLPASITIDLNESEHYYILVTSLGTATSVLCVGTPEG